MFGTIRAKRAAKRARRLYELQRLRDLLETVQRENQRLDSLRNAPCEHCVAMRREAAEAAS